MTLEELEKIIEVEVGETNFKLLSKLGIDEEFAEFGKKMIQLYDMAMESMGNGNIDPKRLIEINETYDIAAADLSKKVKLGKDQTGLPVTLEQLFGEQKSVRPEFMAFRQCVLMCFWISNKKLKIYYEELAGKKHDFKAVRIGGLR